MKTTFLKPVFMIGLMCLLVAGCGAPAPTTVTPEITPTQRDATYFSWTPRWASDRGDAQQSRIYLVQGLPGYSLIAGKDTLVAFAPSPAGMRTDRDSAWLDVYKLEAWGTEFPELSYILGEPAKAPDECDSQGQACAEMNFHVPGTALKSPGDYWFMVTWTDKNGNQIVDSIVARLQAPAVLKVLIVAVNEDIFNAPDLKQAAMQSIAHYFSRMPFASDAIDEVGPEARYWDIYPQPVAIDRQALAFGSCSPYKLCPLTAPIGQALSDYNQTAAVKADIAVGLFFATGCGGVGCANGNVALCDAGSPGACTHEIGHILKLTEESWDQNAATYTCGYFDDETDDSFYCHDWAYAGAGQIIATAENVMSWSGNGTSGFYTRHFYESMCIFHGGGCESARSSFMLTSLDGGLYLQGDSHTGQVALSSEGGEAQWSADLLRRQDDTRTWISLSVYYPGGCQGYCPFSLLIGNPRTGELKTTDPGYYSSPANAAEFADWCHEWIVDQVAADIVTLSCYAFRGGFLNDRILIWGNPPGAASLSLPGVLHEEHWTAMFQWRVVRPGRDLTYP